MDDTRDSTCRSWMTPATQRIATNSILALTKVPGEQRCFYGDERQGTRCTSSYLLHVTTFQALTWAMTRKAAFGQSFLDNPCLWNATWFRNTENLFLTACFPANARLLASSFIEKKKGKVFKCVFNYYKYNVGIGQKSKLSFTLSDSTAMFDHFLKEEEKKKRRGI